MPSKQRSRAGVPQIEGVRKARALAMLERKVKGASNVEVAREFQCDPETVTRTLQWADKSGLIRKAEDTLYDKLLNKSMTVYEKALDEGDVGVATKVLETIGIIRKAKEQPVRSGEQDGESWEAYLVKRKARPVAGQVISSTPIDVIPTPAASAPEGDPQ